MRIGIVSTYPPIECGIATYAEALCQALREKQQETFVVTQFGAQGEKVFPVCHPESPSFAADVFLISSRMTPDVVHIQHEYGLYGSQKGVGIVDLILRYRLAGIPVVMTLHTVYEQLDQQERLILKHVVDDCSAVIVHEEFQKETLERAFGKKDNIHVIEHGIREIEPIPDAKQKLGLQDKKVILLVGYFRRTKNFHKIVELFPQILEREKDAILLVAGKIRNPAMDKYGKEFFKIIHESPVVDNIKVLRGQFPQHTFDTIISAADVVVLPYEKGAQSGIMSQCYAMQKPVVASNLTAFCDIIERSKAGFACANDDEYVERILEVLNSSEIRNTFIKNIKEYVSKQAGWSKIADKHIAVYKSLVEFPYDNARYIYFPEKE